MRRRKYLSRIPGDPFKPPSISGQAFDAATKVRIDAATAEVLRGFGAVGAQAVVLKGPAVAAWLYADGGRRPYLDSDLLVRPDDQPRAEAVLRKLGFEPRVDHAAMPAWWEEHGSEWSRTDDGVLLDLHRSLPGVRTDDETAWDVLSHGTQPILIAGMEAPALSLAGRALHVSLHAAQHGSGWGKGIGDLERALELADASVWDDASELARRLQATDAFAAGLRLVPAGRELADRLGLPAGDAVDVAIRATTPPPVALGIEQLAGA